MAVYQIVLVAYRNGHRHVVVGWGHGLLEKKVESKRDRDRDKFRFTRCTNNLRILVIREKKTRCMEERSEKYNQV